MSLFAMIPMGFGQMLGGFFIGHLIDRKGMKFAILIASLVFSISFITIILYIHYSKFSAFTFLVTFLWGFQDSVTGNILNCTLGFEFDSKI